MRLLIPLPLLVLPLLLVCAQNSSQTGTASRTTGTQLESQLLRLTISILKEDYCSDRNAAFLQWRLKLTYTNIGNRPLLVDKKSTWIYRSLVSRDLKAAAAERYEQAPSVFYPDLGAMGFSNTPEEGSFVLLKPGETFNGEADCRVSIYDGRPDTNDNLHPGNHILQVRVATWYYYADPKTYRDQWASRGYLYSGNITSVPMAFTIKNVRNLPPCARQG